MRCHSEAKRSLTAPRPHLDLPSRRHSKTLSPPFTGPYSNKLIIIAVLRDGTPVVLDYYVEEDVSTMSAMLNKVRRAARPPPLTHWHFILS